MPSKAVLTCHRRSVQAVKGEQGGLSLDQSGERMKERRKGREESDRSCQALSFIDLIPLCGRENIFPLQVKILRSGGPDVQ